MTSPSLAQASHLSRRAGFSARDDIVQLVMSSASMDEAVESIITLPGSLTNLPEWHANSPFVRSDDEEQQQINQQTRNRWARELKFWWFSQMVANQSPLQEKMTLFWANHFTSSLTKVKWPPAILAQNQLLRSQATGSFRTMLNGIVKDPAMLLYLDNASSVKGSPNENFARELLELFTLGEGEYSEFDVKELARALTGASVNRQTGLYQFNARTHDDGEKVIFGRTGTFTPDDVADLILTQPQVAPFICRKLCTFFIGEQPDENRLQQLADLFVVSNFELAPVLKAIFLSEEFWAQQGNIVKSPMELLVGGVQLFAIPRVSQTAFLTVSKSMGQDLFDPPHVKGWAEGKAWYNTSTLPWRERVTQFIARNATVTPSETQVLAVDSVVSLPDPSHRSYINLTVNDPAYQVV